MPKQSSQDSDDWVIPEEANINSIWKQVAFPGTELDALKMINAEPWFFAHLDEELDTGFLSEQKRLYIFGGSEGLLFFISIL